ncbi:MAG: hypothetical protein ACLGI2_11815 [Acidimicrobiia bacterium]
MGNALAARGYLCRPDGDVVHIEFPHPGVVGLGNLWQLCLAAPPRRWPGLVERFLDSVLPGLEPPPDEDLEAVRPALRVRVVPDDPEEGRTRPPLAARPVAEGLRAVLAVDRPTMVELVPAARLARWPASEDELFEQAYANVRADRRPAVSVAPVEDGVLLTRIGGESFYTATWAFWLPELLGPLPPAGVLLGLPTRHDLIAHPIAGVGAVGAIQPMSTVIAQAHRAGPGSLSPHLFWWRDGSLRRLPFAVKAGTFRFQPPDDFLDALNGAA